VDGLLAQAGTGGGVAHLDYIEFSWCGANTNGWNPVDRWCPAGRDALTIAAVLALDRPVATFQLAHTPNAGA